MLVTLMMSYDPDRYCDLDNELTEACLITLEAMAKAMPSEMGAHLESVFSCSLTLMQFDPNYIYNEEDEEMSEEEQGGDDWGSDFDEDE